MEGEKVNPDIEASTSRAAEHPNSPRAAKSSEVEIFEPVVDPPEVVDLERGNGDDVPLESNPSEGGEGEDSKVLRPQGAVEAPTFALGDDWEEVPLPKSGPDVCPYVKKSTPTSWSASWNFRSSTRFPRT